MTFGGEVKNELCRGELHRKCCAQAEGRTSSHNSCN